MTQNKQVTSEWRVRVLQQWEKNVRVEEDIIVPHPIDSNLPKINNKNRASSLYIKRHGEACRSILIAPMLPTRFAPIPKIRCCILEIASIKSSAEDYTVYMAYSVTWNVQ